MKLASERQSSLLGFFGGLSLGAGFGSIYGVSETIGYLLLAMGSLILIGVKFLPAQSERRGSNG